MTTRITTQNITDATITTTDIATSVPLAVDWQAIVTSNTTMVAGRGYIIDSSGGTITMTLPASPSLGDTVAIAALDGQTNIVTIARNSKNIEGNASNLIMQTNYQTMSLVYSDATNGWYRQNKVQPDTYINATGGTITNSGNYRIHTFNSSSNFVVAAIGETETAENEVSSLVVAGGGGGGACGGAGGGAGGFRESRNATSDTYTKSPLEGGTSVTVTAQTYPITVGAGGAGVATQGSGSNGSSSVFSTITSAGGGGGGYYQPTNPAPAATRGQTGGSGGGSGGVGPDATTPGTAGNTPPVSPPQGNAGGSGRHIGGSSMGSGGGGGATGAGGNASTNNPGPGHGQGGAGGTGATTHISGSPVAYAGGGGGAGYGSSGGSGASPCGTGGTGGPNNSTASVAGTTNRGGGGGGGAHSGGGPNGGSVGGSGVVIIRYKYQ